MSAALTLSDLTVNEYGILATKIGGDPIAAMSSPNSTRYAQAHAGLLWLSDKRAGTAGTWPQDYDALTMAEVLTRLGLADEQAPEAPDQLLTTTGPTVVEAAAQAAAEVHGGVSVDPTAPQD